MASNNLQALVIDDDPIIAKTIEALLPENWSLTNLTTFNNEIKGPFHLALVDLYLETDDETAEAPSGLEHIKKLSNKYPNLPIIAMSSCLDREIMEKTLLSGALRFLPKPISSNEFLAMLMKIESLYQLQEASNRWAAGTTWIGKSEASENVRKWIANMRGESGPILIEGESGTGKEVIANLLHRQEGPRPFIIVNVASIPENLFESEFFGHVKGAFTGAVQQRIGLAEAATGGDLFLDEIEALPLSMQPKFLRLLENGEIRKVGSNQSSHVQIRIIAATNRNLKEMVKEGDFREDLLWRLSGKKLTIPPLKDRKSDVIDLAKYFMASEKNVSRKIFGEDALIELQKYNWPGNVRELKRVVEQLSYLAPLPIIRAEDVNSILNPLAEGSDPSLQSNKKLSLTERVQEFEKELIRSVLEIENDIDKIASDFQISRSNLYKKIKDYKLRE